jgi:hypothetical protein
MARFYCNVQGNRGEATRMGTPASGITAHPRGWNVGVRVEGHAEGEADVFRVYLTGGSAGYSSELIGEARLDEGGRPVFTPASERVLA